MRFIRHLRAAWAYAKGFPYFADSEQLEWTDSDAATVRNFFSHDAGAKLMLRLESAAMDMALDAIHKGTPHACGLAAGAAMQITGIKNHFPPVQSASGETEESIEQAAMESSLSTA